MNEQLTTKTANPFAARKQELTSAGNAESDRAIQEVQASLVIAKKFPRDQVAAMDRILNACTRPSLAAQSLYSYAKGGTDITGPSIRLAEAIAQNWGNMQFGVKEVGRFVKDGIGHSEVEAFAWDLETNTRKPVQFVVKHWRDTKGGGYALKDERDIYELVANQAARRLRSCILAIIPGDVTEAAQNQCELTNAAEADTSPEKQAQIVRVFEKYGITKAQIEKRIQRRMEAIQPAQVISLGKIMTSIRDGISTAEEWFDQIEEKPKEFHPQAKPDAEAEADKPKRGRPPKAAEPAEPAKAESTWQRVTVTGSGIACDAEGTISDLGRQLRYTDSTGAEGAANTFSKRLLPFVGRLDDNGEFIPALEEGAEVEIIVSAGTPKWGQKLEDLRMVEGDAQ